MVDCVIDNLRLAIALGGMQTPGGVGVTKRRRTTTCSAMLIGADNEHRSSPAERNVSTRWSTHWGWRVADRRRLHSTPPRSTAAGRAWTTKREQVYADFIMDASKLLLNAYVHEELTLSVDQQHLVGLANRMRLFAPPTVIHEAEAVIKGLIEILLKPSIDLRKLRSRSYPRLQFRSASTIQPGLPSGLGSGVPNRALNSANSRRCAQARLHEPQ